MEDLSVVLKKSFLEQLYKKKTETFGTVKERVDKMNVQRKNNRHEAVFEKRKIPINMTPVPSPTIKPDKVENNPKVIENPPNKRLEMLAKWKVDKEKKKIQQKNNQKPIFKVTHVEISVGLPNLETVNREIKGKAFKSKFAPPNHKFKPPPNIQPIKFNYGQVKATENSQPSRIVTRSQTKGANDKLKSESGKLRETTNKIVTKSRANLKTDTGKAKELKSEGKKEKKIPTKNRKTTTKKDKENKVKTDQVQEGNVISTNTCRKSENEENGEPEVERKDNGNADDEKTPSKTEPPVYISPFITLSRGKDNARKEYEARRSRKSFGSKSSLDCTSPTAGAAYFTWLLDNQIRRLQELCDRWNQYKVDENSPEEAVSMIDVAIGQTNLLLTKKCVQFQGLIDRCRNKDSETPVTCEDLHGFWDVMYIQIENLDKRFEDLDKMKENNWEEIIPETKKVIVKKKGKSIKVAKASSGLMEAIRAARKKKQDENLENIEEVKCEEKTSLKNRVSSQLFNVKSSRGHPRHSSPGLMMMKVAQYAKGVDTPIRSILKSSDRKSVKNQSKSVLFHGGTNQNIDDAENDLNASNSHTPDKSPLRRSNRLSKIKLF